MGALVFLLLFFLGLLISTVGSVIGIVDAFRVSALWGVLALFVPFALLVFCIKFWNQRKWARNGLIIGLSGLGLSLISLLLGGGITTLMARNAVGDLEDFSVEEVPTDPNTQPEVGEGEAVEVPAEDPEGADEEAELFEEAMLPGLPTAAEIARAELLPSTDPNERIKEIESQRADPYAIVTVPPPAPPAPPAPASPPGGGQTTVPQPTTTAANPPTAPANGGGTQGPGGVGTAPGAPPGAGRPSEPLPDLPEPTVVASQVEVSGVASINGEKYAIVKAPGEPTSRYVKVGDRLSNGTVLVKRIESRPGGSPMVVFEERGEEIALPVGANVGAPDEPATEQASTSSPIATLPIPSLN